MHDDNCNVVAQLGALTHFNLYTSQPQQELLLLDRHILQIQNLNKETKRRLPTKLNHKRVLAPVNSLLYRLAYNQHISPQSINTGALCPIVSQLYFALM